VRIVGRDLGAVAGPWLRPEVVQDVSAARGVEAPAGEDLTDADLVAQALQGSGASAIEEAKGRYVVDVPVSGGRRAVCR